MILFLLDNRFFCHLHLRILTSQNTHISEYSRLRILTSQNTPISDCQLLRTLTCQNTHISDCPLLRMLTSTTRVPRTLLTSARIIKQIEGGIGIEIKYLLSAHPPFKRGNTSRAAIVPETTIGSGGGHTPGNSSTAPNTRTS